jgi:hypothetical protein
MGLINIEMIEIPIPEIEKGEILVQLKVGSICGSDLPYFLFKYGSLLIVLEGSRCLQLEGPDPCRYITRGVFLTLR